MKQQKRNTIFAGVSFLETDQRISLGVSCFEKRNTQVPSPVSSASSAGRGFAFRIHSSLGGVACWYIKPLKLPKQHEKVGIRKIPTWKSRDWRNRKQPYGVVGGNVDICLRSGVKSGEIWKGRCEIRCFVSRIETETFPAPSACVSRETKRKFEASFLFRFYFRVSCETAPQK